VKSASDEYGNSTGDVEIAAEDAKDMTTETLTKHTVPHRTEHNGSNLLKWGYSNHWHVSYLSLARFVPINAVCKGIKGIANRSPR